MSLLHAEDTPSASPALPPISPPGSPTPSSLPPSLPPPHSKLDAIREQVFALASSETLDKGSALTVTRLFHEMETLLRHECSERDRRLRDVTNELERQKLQREVERLGRQHTLHESHSAQALVEPRRRSRF